MGGYAIMHLSVFEKENTMRKRERENTYWWTIDKVKGRLCVQRHDKDRENKDIDRDNQKASYLERGRTQW